MMVALAASSVSLVGPLTTVNAQPIGKSAELSDMTVARLKRGLPTAALPFAKAAALCIEAVFPNRSRHATAMQAADALGASVDTVTRILAGETGRIDAQLLFRCLAAYQAKFDRAFPIGGGLGVAIVEIGK